MNILVTGAAGYVGSICAEALSQSGHSVIALDNLSDGHREAVLPEAIFCECDLRDHDQVSRIFNSHRIDAVMHFAAAALVEESVRNPSRSFLVNVAYGLNLLDAMLRHNVRDLVFSSTAAVYGEPQIVPIPEDHPTVPINPYGRSKLTFERILEEYRVCAGLRWVALRYFNAAGASQQIGEDHHPETHVIPLLLDAAAGQREQFQVFGDDYPTPDGSCVRDYVHVRDIADAHIRTLAAMDRLSGRVFNIGNGQGYSVQQVLAAAEKITGRKIRTVVGPRRAGDPAVLVASSEKIRRETGWEPRFPDLESIIGTAWDWKLRHPRGYQARQGIESRVSG